MKKVLIVLAAAAMVFGISACSSIESATTLNGVKLSESDSAPVAHLYGKTWGIYLFHMLPLFTGSTTHPGSCAIFRDTVKVDPAVNMLTNKAQSLGATKVLDLQSSTSSVCLPLLISYKSVEVSGNALK